MTQTQAKEDVIALLLRQHREIRRLFTQLDTVTGDVRREAFRSLVLKPPELPSLPGHQHRHDADCQRAAQQPAASALPQQARQRSAPRDVKDRRHELRAEAFAIGEPRQTVRRLGQAE
jgi:hypothetical protein